MKRAFWTSVALIDLIALIALVVVLVILMRPASAAPDTSAKCYMACSSQPTGCPYGDAVPLGDQCDKLAQEQTTENMTTPQAEPTILDWGK